MTKFNKIYLQKDALKNAVENHQDFDTWYEDGELFLHFESKQGWTREKDHVQIIGRMGGQVGLIKPDNKAVVYEIKYERFDYRLHTYVINQHYYIEGMVWDLYGSFYNPPFALVEETLTSFDRKAAYVRLTNFKGKGECYEIHVRELEKLRLAVASIVAIGLKETWKGKSEGEDREYGTRLERIKRQIFDEKGYTFEQIQEMIKEGHPLVQVIKPTGRPIDSPQSRYRKKHEKKKKEEAAREKNLEQAKQAYREIRKKNKK